MFQDNIDHLLMSTTNDLDSNEIDLKKKVVYYRNEIIRRNKIINNLVSCLHNLVIKNNEYDEANCLYINEIERIKYDLNKTTNEYKEVNKSYDDLLSKMQRGNEILEETLKKFSSNTQEQLIESQQKLNKLNKNYEKLHDDYKNATELLINYEQLNKNLIYENENLKLKLNKLNSESELIEIETTSSSSSMLSTSLYRNNSIHIQPYQSINEDSLKHELNNLIKKFDVDLEQQDTTTTSATSIRLCKQLLRNYYYLLQRNTYLIDLSQIKLFESFLLDFKMISFNNQSDNQQQNVNLVNKLSKLLNLDCVDEEIILNKIRNDALKLANISNLLANLRVCIEKHQLLVKNNCNFDDEKSCFIDEISTFMFDLHKYDNQTVLH